MTRILCVAEKPSIARAISNHLGGGNATTRSIQHNVYVKNYDFNYNFPAWGPCQVTVTSVSGHLLSNDFASQYRKWTSCEPSELFEARIETYVDDSHKPIAENIKRQARNAHKLFIWTDCDREGENIGTEIRQVAQQANQRFNDPSNT
ncbi:hypothetical protein KC315_g15860, partial [Hortaea werneckii]